MIYDAREYVKKKSELASVCLAKTVEYHKQRKENPFEPSSEAEYWESLREQEDALRKIWSPLTDFQESYPEEPNYYLKKGAFYSRVFFTPGIENVPYIIITDEKVPRRFIKNQLKRNSWSLVITKDFIMRYTILHLTWFVNIMRTCKPGETPQENSSDIFPFPRSVPKCKHCDRHFVKMAPNQKYCDICRSTLKKMGFNPFIDKDKHRYCLNCGKHLSNDKHKKAKFCQDSCRIVYFRKKQKENI